MYLRTQRTIQNETQEKEQVLKITDHQWAMGQFQTAKYTDNWCFRRKGKRGVDGKNILEK